MDSLASWNAQAWILPRSRHNRLSLHRARQDISVVPSCHRSAEDLGQEAGIQLQFGDTRHGVEHCNSTQSQWNMDLGRMSAYHPGENPIQITCETRNHVLGRVLAHQRTEAARRHWNVSSAKVVVALVPRQGGPLWQALILAPGTSWCCLPRTPSDPCCCPRRGRSA